VGGGGAPEGRRRIRKRRGVVAWQAGGRWEMQAAWMAAALRIAGVAHWQAVVWVLLMS